MISDIKIYRKENYVYIYDMDKNVLYQEHSFRVFVKETGPKSGIYDIVFLRPEVTPGAFYSVSYTQIYNEDGDPFSQADWETWYQLNTGDLHTTTVLAPSASTDCFSASTTVICKEQFQSKVQPVITTKSGNSGFFDIPVYSISFASIGTADASVSFDQGATYTTLSPGTTVNMDAGINAWYYEENRFYWDTTNLGAQLLITYNRV
jgi:hypothetical protein